MISNTIPIPTLAPAHRLGGVFEKGTRNDICIGKRSPIVLVSPRSPHTFELLPKIRCFQFLRCCINIFEHQYVRLNIFYRWVSFLGFSRDSIFSILRFSNSRIFQYFSQQEHFLFQWINLLLWNSRPTHMVLNTLGFCFGHAWTHHSWATWLCGHIVL